MVSKLSVSFLNSSKNARFFVGSLLLLIGRVSPSFAVEVVIPEVNARMSEEFTLEATAKLDDFIEDVKKKIQLKDKEGYAFAASMVVQLGIGTGALWHYHSNSEKGVTAVVDGVKKAGSLGRASLMPARMIDMARRWGLLAAAGHAANNAIKEKPFTVHADDLGVFVSVLRRIRSRQAALLGELTRARGGTTAQLEQRILENRPSFKRIYEPCAADPDDYKTNILIDTYSKGMWEYFKVLTTDPDALTAQINAGFVSPTLSSYLGQEVLPVALKKCFKVSSNDVGTFSTDEGQRFVASLAAIDALSKFVVVAAVISIVRLEELRLTFHRLSPASKMKTLNNMQLGWVAKVTKPVRDLFAKISPSLIKKAMITTQVATSSFNFASLAKDWYKIKSEVGTRRTVDEFNLLAEGYFHDRAAAQIEELGKALAEPGLDLKDKVALEQELKNWYVIYSEFRSDKQSILSAY